MNHKKRTLCVGNLLAITVASTAASSCTDPREQEAVHRETAAAPAPVFELEQRAVYGEDDRLNYEEVKNPAIRRVADAVAAMIPQRAMDCDEDACSVTKVFEKARKFYIEGLGLPQIPLCEDARFRGQSQASICTAFLLEPDLVLTAGHCLTEKSWLPDPCQDIKFVFGYTSSKTFAPETKILQRDVYGCKEILQSLVTTPANGPHTKDWAFVRLDRPVQDREPIGLVRREGAPSSDRLFTVGHPFGLPQKIALNGKVVTDIPGRATFTAELESDLGNSGGPVLGPDGTVEGILIGSAQSDFSYDLENDCLRGTVCRKGDHYRPICEEGDRLTLSRYSTVLRMPAVIEGLKCSNGERDEGEGDVDCGGACAPCAEGRSCLVGSDCSSSVCQEGSCVPPSCADRVQNQGEQRIDWGGPCARAEEGYLIETFKNDERWVFGRDNEGFGVPRWEVGSGVLSNQFFLSSFDNPPEDLDSSVKTILELPAGPNSKGIEIRWSSEQTMLGWGLPDTQIRVLMNPVQCGPGAEPQEETLFVPVSETGTSLHVDSFRLSQLRGTNGSESCLLELKFELVPADKRSIFGMLWSRIQIREIRITP